MQDGYSNNITPVNNDDNTQNEVAKSGINIVQTDLGAKDGQNKCPKCGATDISTNVNTARLRCNFCRHEFEPEKIAGLDQEISELQGQVFGSGAQDIVADTNDMVTLKCSSCAAEVVIDTAAVTQARCHWCRNTLSINEQIPNGAIPDVILPFTVTKEEARSQIEAFVKKRKFFANPKFKAEFTTENIMGVYFPYMVVDVNSHAHMEGVGEKLIRTYTRGSNDNETRYYDADAFTVVRDFDVYIDDLTVESSSQRLNNASKAQTNNVINAIMPFDLENAVKWNANYIKGYTSEKRDTNIDELRVLVQSQSKDVARFAANDSLKEYNRGVAWREEDLKIKGQLWKAAYLPVWLYSYQQVSGNKKILHYVAVNARSKETMGSVPIHKPKLFIVSALVELLGFILFMLTLSEDSDYSWIFLLAGFIYYAVIYAKYRNAGERHKHETETKKRVENLVCQDQFLETRKGLRNSRIAGMNNTNVFGTDVKQSMFGKIAQENPLAGAINQSFKEGGDKK